MRHSITCCVVAALLAGCEDEPTHHGVVPAGAEELLDGTQDERLVRPTPHAAGPSTFRTTPAASRLCIVRHAEAYKNLEPPPTGLTAAQLDTLTPRGEAQARAVAATLPDGARIWSSPAQRARQTAELLHGASPVVVEPDLRPLDGGIPWNERMAAWSRGQDPRPAGGESLADGAARAATLVRRLPAQLDPHEHAVVVTHGDMASILLGAGRGTPLLQRPARDTLDTGKATCIPLAAAAGVNAPSAIPLR